MTLASLLLPALERLPFGGLDEILAPGPVLVLAPHPDDESLGCGGLIAEATARGREVHVAILTDGAMSHPGSAAWPPRRLAMQRGAEVREATGILGVPANRLHLLGQPDSDAPHKGPSFEALARQIEALVAEAGANTLIAAWGADPHGDHGSAHKLAVAVSECRRIRHVAYPVWAWTLAASADISAHLIPADANGIRGRRLDIGHHLGTKRAAIAAHRSQRGLLIHDDPDGFALPASFLALFDRPWEVYLRMSLG